MEREIGTGARSESHGKTFEFIRTAINEGATSKVPKHMALENWLRELHIGTAYHQAGLTLEEVGKQHNLTRPRIGEICRAFIIHLRKNSSSETQKSFPLATIAFGEPLSQASRERKSRAHGGAALRVKALIEKGVRDPREISEELGLSPQSLSTARKTLKGWGIDVPYFTRRRAENYHYDPTSKK